MEQEKVVLDEILDSAKRSIIRNGLGEFNLSGPRQNVMSVESRVALSTVVNELFREGYQMVSPEEYADNYGIAIERVQQKIHAEGTLFLLLYESAEGRHEAVPLDEMEGGEGLGPQLA